MSATEIAVLVSSGCSLIALMVSIWAKLTARETKDIEQLRSEQDDEKRRLAKIEAMLEAAPKAESVHELRVDVARIEGQLGVIGERLKPVAQVTERLQDWLLENKR
jgi:hypothetical protein